MFDRGHDMKILVIATGGTIGSSDNGMVIDVSEKMSCAVVDGYRARYGEAAFDTVTPLRILSESITAADWNTLCRVLLTTDTAPYDGVILTCGSDNLAYIAAMCALLWRDKGAPLCIVAADKVLSDPRSNGPANFACAVEVIWRGIAGAYVPYRNSDGVMYIHAAADIRQADLSDDFYSFMGVHAVYDDGVRVRCPYIDQAIPAVFTAERPPVITDSVLLIHPYPMLNYAAYDLSGTRAVLHTLYHSGTLDSDRAAVLTENLGDRPLYLASLRSGRMVYRTTAAMLQQGAVPLYDISPECAYCKLLLACAQDVMSVRAFMEAGR